MYGMKTKPEDPYVEIAEEALEGINEATAPGKFLVEIFPIMKHIPSWFPGAGWKRKAHYWRDINREVRLKSFNLVKDQVVNNVHRFIIYF
jgi:hypothetical protein